MFFLLSYPIPTALIRNISVKELDNIMQKERQEMYTLGTRRNIPVVLEIKEGNKFINSPLRGPLRGEVILLILFFNILY